MAARGWGGSVVTGIGVAAGAGAAQLGVGYGLGIIAWPTSAAGASETDWVASLAWATWIASTSAVAGAICADRLGPSALSTLEGRDRRGRVTTSLWRVVLALAAGIGALITVPLVGIPARAVDHPWTSATEILAGGYAVVGVILGLIVAIAALAARAVATNVMASVSWLWLLAIVAVVDGVAAGPGLNTAQLAVWKFTAAGPVVRNIHVWQALLTLGAALVIGALAALPAARRGDNPVGIAVSGAVGPVLVAAAYFLAAPDFALVQPRELSAYLVVPYAVIAGLAGSVTIAGLGPRLAPRPGPAPALTLASTPAMEATESPEQSPTPVPALSPATDETPNRTRGRKSTRGTSARPAAGSASTEPSGTDHEPPFGSDSNSDGDGDGEPERETAGSTAGTGAAGGSARGGGAWAKLRRGKSR
jgi:hypothetical protein